MTFGNLNLMQSKSPYSVRTKVNSRPYITYYITINSFCQVLFLKFFYFFFDTY